MPTMSVTKESTNIFDLLYKLNTYIYCHFLTLISYILSKTDHGCSTVLNLRLLRVEEQEETLINTLLNLFSTCVCACALHEVESAKNGEMKVWLSTILEFHNKRFYFWAIIASAFWTYLWNFARPYSCWDQVITHTHTHTQTDYYNPPPTLGLIMLIYKIPPLQSGNTAEPI